MIRLGLQLVLASGREALTRLLVITLAVAAGVALLSCRSCRVPGVPGKQQPALLGVHEYFGAAGHLALPRTGDEL